MEDDGASLSQIREDFYKQHFGVVHERLYRRDDYALESEVIVFAPSRRRPFFTLVTNGMSDYSFSRTGELVHTGKGEDFSRIELMICVEDLEEEVDWDISWANHFLKSFSVLPHRARRPLLPGQVVPNGSPAAPIMEESKLVAAFFIPPIFESRAVNEGILLPDGSNVTIMGLDFITEKERRFYDEQGADALGKLFLANNHRRCVDPLRRSYL